MQVLRSQVQQGRRRLTPTANGAQTDDTGSFRVFGLAPGEYYVAASLQAAPADSSDNPVSYAPTYFPGTGNIADAQRITLTLGTEQSGINFVLQPVRAVRVSGTVVDSNGAPTQALLNLTPAGFGDDGGLQMGNPARVLPDGTFTILNVVPGEYVLTVNGRANGNATPEVASMPLTVGNDDLAGVSIATSKGGTIRGTDRRRQQREGADDEHSGVGAAAAAGAGRFPAARAGEQRGHVRVERPDRRAGAARGPPAGGVDREVDPRQRTRHHRHRARVPRLRGGDRSGRADQSHQRGQWRGQGERTAGHVGERRALSGGCRAVGVPVPARAHGARRSERRLPRAIAAAGRALPRASPWTISSRASSRTRCSSSACSGRATAFSLSDGENKNLDLTLVER